MFKSKMTKEGVKGNWTAVHPEGFGWGRGPGSVQTCQGSPQQTGGTVS